MAVTVRDLESALEAFSAIRFPADVEDYEASVLHVELVDYDAYSVGLIMQLVAGNAPLTYPLKIDSSLRVRLERLAADTDPSREAAATGYLRYMDHLEHLIRLGMSYQRDREI